MLDLLDGVRVECVNEKPSPMSQPGGGFSKSPDELHGIHKRQSHDDVRGRPRCAGRKCSSAECFSTAADDALKRQGMETRFRVRETPEWKRHAALYRTSRRPQSSKSRGGAVRGTPIAPIGRDRTWAVWHFPAEYCRAAHRFPVAWDCRRSGALKEVR